MAKKTTNDDSQKPIVKSDQAFEVQNLHLKQQDIENLIHVVRGCQVMLDRDLALLICNAQYTFQQYFFGAIAEQHYENSQTAAAANHRLQQRTILAFRRLPDPFTSEDVKREYGYDNIGSVCSRLKHLQDDGLAQKIRTGVDKGKYRKLA